MSNYIIGINILKQLIIGVCFCRKGLSINFLILSIEIHWGVGADAMLFSFHNEFRRPK